MKLFKKILKILSSPAVKIAVKLLKIILSVKGGDKDGKGRS